MKKNILVLLFAALLCFCILPLNKAAETELDVQVETSAEDGELVVSTDVTVTEGEEGNENNNNEAGTGASGEQGEIVVLVPEEQGEEESAEGVVVVVNDNESNINEATNSEEIAPEVEMNVSVQENEGGFFNGENDMNNGEGEMIIVVQPPVVVTNDTSGVVVVDNGFLNAPPLSANILTVSGVVFMGIVGLFVF